MRKSDFDLPIADEAPNSSTLTNYDEQHLLTYLRLLDAHAEGAEWDEAALLVLHIDPRRAISPARNGWSSTATLHFCMKPGNTEPYQPRIVIMPALSRLSR
jgi:hypothetical protein